MTKTVSNCCQAPIDELQLQAGDVQPTCSKCGYNCESEEIEDEPVVKDPCFNCRHQKNLHKDGLNCYGFSCRCERYDPPILTRSCSNQEGVCEEDKCTCK